MDNNNNICSKCQNEIETQQQEISDATQKFDYVQFCTSIAACLNRLRIIPRIIVFSYGYMVYTVIQWYMELGIAATTQQTSFVSVITGIAPLVFSFYMQGGSSHPPNKNSASLK